MAHQNLALCPDLLQVFVWQEGIWIIIIIRCFGYISAIFSNYNFVISSYGMNFLPFKYFITLYKIVTLS